MLWRCVVGGSGGGFEGDPVAQGGELGDVVTHAPLDVDAAGVVVGAEVMEAGEGVGQRRDHGIGPAARRPHPVQARSIN